MGEVEEMTAVRGRRGMVRVGTGWHAPIGGPHARLATTNVNRKRFMGCSGRYRVGKAVGGSHSVQKGVRDLSLVRTRAVRSGSGPRCGCRAACETIVPDLEAHTAKTTPAGGPPSKGSCGAGTLCEEGGRGTRRA